MIYPAKFLVFSSIVKKSITLCTGEDLSKSPKQKSPLRLGFKKRPCDLISATKIKLN